MGELTEKVKQLILSLQVTSAGGDSPKINVALQVDDTIDLDTTIDEMVGKKQSKKPTAGFGKKLEGKDVITDVKKRIPFDKSRGLADLIGGTQGQAGNLINLAKNPTGAISGIMGALGKTLPFIAVITTILSLPTVVKKIGDFLTAPGSPFDKRLKIISTDALNAFLSRQEQRNLQIGKRQIIFTTNIGFRNSGGALTGNSFKNLGTGQNISGPDIGTTRTASILDKAEGI